MIEELTLKSFGADIEEYNAGDTVFKEGEVPQFYYQIAKGNVKLNNVRQNNKELIHCILNDKQGIAEFTLFMNKTYPVNAVAITACEVLKLHKAGFLDLLVSYPNIYSKIICNLSDFVHFRLLMGGVLFEQNPASKLISLLDHLKSSQDDRDPFSYQVPFTRQQLASLTGLRVETTIRTLKIMEKENVVKISNGKVFY